jgi:hypothetical protein
MTDPNRKPLVNRLAALLAGPFLLGRRALSFDWAQASPPEPPPKATASITVTFPEHAIKRRG